MGQEKYPTGLETGSGGNDRYDAVQIAPVEPMEPMEPTTFIPPIQIGDPMWILLVSAGTLLANYLLKPLLTLIIEALQRDAGASVELTELLNRSISRLEEDKEHFETQAKVWAEERKEFLSILSKFASSADRNTAVLALHAEKLEAIHSAIVKGGQE